MMIPENIRNQALSFLNEEGLEREFLEHICITNNDAKELINIILSSHRNPKRILEVGTFVGVSSVVLGLSIPQAHIVCVDPDLPTQAHVCLGSGNYYTNTSQTAFYFFKKLIKKLGIVEQITLHKGFFSCYPVQECIEKLASYGVNIQSYQIIGERICEQYGSFEIVFLDADHRKSSVYSDLTLIYSYIAPGGMIILHDAGSGYWGEQVISGTQEFLAQHSDITFYVQGEFGVLYKVG
ncbi:class I SAM-dependent methyltransferase [Nostoc calcicola FACHB-3891]|nr:class I SAM-dependent methyltransferase [Nostoc calcicola FACHB-3891]